MLQIFIFVFTAFFILIINLNEAKGSNPKVALNGFSPVYDNEETYGSDSPIKSKFKPKPFGMGDISNKDNVSRLLSDGLIIDILPNGNNLPNYYGKNREKSRRVLPKDYEPPLIGDLKNPENVAKLEEEGTIVDTLPKGPNREEILRQIRNPKLRPVKKDEPLLKNRKIRRPGQIEKQEIHKPKEKIMKPEQVNRKPEHVFKKVVPIIKESAQKQDVLRATHTYYIPEQNNYHTHQNNHMITPLQHWNIPEQDNKKGSEIDMKKGERSKTRLADKLRWLTKFRKDR